MYLLFLWTFRGATYDKDNLALGFHLGKMGNQLAKGTTTSLGELFAYLTANRSLSILSHHLRQLNQCLQEAIGTLVDNLSARLGSDFAKPSLASFLLGQKTFEAELLVGQTALDKRWNESGGSWQTFHLNAEP